MSSKQKMYEWMDNPQDDDLNQFVQKLIKEGIYIRQIIPTAWTDGSSNTQCNVIIALILTETP